MNDCSSIGGGYRISEYQVSQLCRAWEKVERLSELVGGNFEVAANLLKNQDKLVDLLGTGGMVVAKDEMLRFFEILTEQHPDPSSRHSDLVRRVRSCSDPLNMVRLAIVSRRSPERAFLWLKDQLGLLKDRQVGRQAIQALEVMVA